MKQKKHKLTNYYQFIQINRYLDLQNKYFLKLSSLLKHLIN